MSSNQANRAALFGSKAPGANKPVTVTATKSTAAPAPATAAPKPAVSQTAGMSIPQAKNNLGLSAESKRKKNEEAKQLLERANNALKTSLFQWQPDYLVAAPLFEQAGDIYKQLGETDLAIENFRKAADGHEKAKATASAALALNKAATLAIEAGLETEAPRLLQGVAEYWAAHGELVRYGETVHRLAKQLEGRLPKKAKEYHWQAIRALVPDDTAKEQLGSAPAVIFDMTRHVFSFFVKQRFFDDALKLTRRVAEISQAFQLDSSFHKALAAETLLTLIKTADVLQAQQLHLAHFSHADYLSSQECDLADLFIVAVQTQDADKFDEARRHPQLNYLDPQLAQILRNELSLDDLVEGVSPYAQKTPAAAAAPVAPAAPTAAAKALFGSNAGKSSSAASPAPPVAVVAPPAPPAPVTVAAAAPSQPEPVHEEPAPEAEVDAEAEAEAEEDVFDLAALEDGLDRDADDESHATAAAAPSAAAAAPAAEEDEEDDLAFLA